VCCIVGLGNAAVHLVLADHDSEIVGHESKLLLQRLVGRSQLCKLRLRLLGTLLRGCRLLVQLSELPFKRCSMVLRCGSIPIMQVYIHVVVFFDPDCIIAATF
jgi:hypothetical protein